MTVSLLSPFIRAWHFGLCVRSEQPGRVLCKVSWISHLLLASCLISILMRSIDRKLCALLGRMATPTTNQTGHQTPLTDKALPYDDSAVSTTKVDCERGANDKEFLPKSPHKTTTCFRLLSLTGLLSLVLLVRGFWPSLSRGVVHGCDHESVASLDDLCPQVEALTPPGYEALLGSLDEEFSTKEFKLKAYESLGGAVRIPCVSSPISLLSAVLIASACIPARNLMMTSDSRPKIPGGKLRPSSINISSHVSRRCEYNTRSTRYT